MADPKFQTSFIPKKAMVEPRAKNAGMGIFLFISIIIFFIAVGVAAFVYLDKQYLVGQITTATQEIKEKQDSFNRLTIEDILTLESRIIVANELLTKHITVSPIFYEFLNKATLPNVRFKNFSFSGANDSSGKVINIQMDGTARDFETVASQADEFGDPKWRETIKNTKVSNLGLNQDGTVSFTISATVLSSAITYKETQI